MIVYYLYSVSDIEKILGENVTPTFDLINSLHNRLFSVTLIASVKKSNLIVFFYNDFLYKYVDVFKYKNKNFFKIVLPSRYAFISSDQKTKELIEFIINNETRQNPNGNISNNYSVINSHGQIWSPKDFMKFVSEWNLIYENKSRSQYVQKLIKELNEKY